MPTEIRDRFATRHRLAITLAASAAVVVMLVLAYRLTAPGSTQTTTSSGERIPESDVLRVGALPVT